MKIVFEIWKLGLDENNRAIDQEQFVDAFDTEKEAREAFEKVDLTPLPGAAKTQIVLEKCEATKTASTCIDLLAETIV